MGYYVTLTLLLGNTYPIRQRGQNLTTTKAKIKKKASRHHEWIKPVANTQGLTRISIRKIPADKATDYIIAL